MQTVARMFLHYSFLLILTLTTFSPAPFNYCRIQVKWDLHVVVPMEESKVAGTSNADGDKDIRSHRQTMTQTVTRWWGATLLHPDGRTHVLTDDGSDLTSSPVQTPQRPADTAVVPIRVLDYDPCEEYGFPERSLEEVVFLSDHNLLNLSSGTRAHYRLEGADWEPSNAEEIGEDGLCQIDLDQSAHEAGATGTTSSDAAAAAVERSSNDDSVVTVSGEEGVRSVLDRVLMKALGGVSDRLNKLDAAQQRIVASKVADAKEKLLTKMMESQGNSGNGGEREHITITPELVKRAMEEISQDL